MTLDIGRAVTEGYSRLTTRTGLLLFGIFLVVGAASAVAQQSLNVAAFEALVNAAESSAAGPEPGFTQEQVQQLRDQLQAQREASPLAVDVPALVAVAVAIALAFVAEAATLVSIRAFAGETTDGLPTDATDRLLPATLNGFLGGVVVAVLVGIGLVFLVLPGVFLYISFLFLRQEIALEDRNFVDALAESWSVAKGDRLTIFGLVAILFAVAIVAVVPTLVGALPGVPQLAGVTIGLLVGPVVTLFGVAVTTRAYVQLREGTATTESDDEGDDEPIGALGPDDIPEP